MKSESALKKKSSIIKMEPLICIFAHPDDEAFGPAGSIAKFASEREVHLICVTNGNADDQFTKKKGYAKSLGEIRRQELNNSAQILGIKSVQFLEFDDGSLSNNLYHKIASKLEQLLDEIRPDTIMTFESNGISGHIDHITVSLVSTYVFQKLDYIKTLLYYAETEAMMKMIPNYFIYVPPGYKKDQLDLTINIEKFWDKKVNAMHAHQTQEEDEKLILCILKNFPKEEHFLVKRK